MSKLRTYGGHNSLAEMRKIQLGIPKDVKLYDNSQCGGYLEEVKDKKLRKNAALFKLQRVFEKAHMWTEQLKTDLEGFDCETLEIFSNMYDRSESAKSLLNEINSYL